MRCLMMRDEVFDDYNVGCFGVRRGMRGVMKGFVLLVFLESKSNCDVRLG